MPGRDTKTRYQGVFVRHQQGCATSTQASRVEANLPTPWAGVTERISIVGYLLWQVVLAIALLRVHARGRLRSPA